MEAGLADRVTDAAPHAAPTLAQNRSRGWERLLAGLGLRPGEATAAGRNALPADRNVLHAVPDDGPRRRAAAEAMRRRFRATETLPCEDPSYGDAVLAPTARAYPEDAICSRGGPGRGDPEPGRGPAPGNERIPLIPQTIPQTLKNTKDMTYLENAKQYTGSELETVFFRPMLTGESARELGVRVLYNMPTPTHVQLWDGQRNILQKYTAAGWSGGAAAAKFEKTIDLRRVKAEMSFSAADYFSMVCEKIASVTNVHLEDLTGTELEKAETALFRQALAENLRATMWVGDASAETGYNTFDGFLKLIGELGAEESVYHNTYQDADLASAEKIVEFFDELWTNADTRTQDLKADGQLAYFLTSDLCHLYEKYLDAKGADAAYADAVNGRPTLSYHGIPVIDVRLGGYLAPTSFDKSFCMLTDRRNLVLAVNTADMPGNEVRMWYNPDEMENRQRAVFMAGCAILDESLVTYLHKQ